MLCLQVREYIQRLSPTKRAEVERDLPICEDIWYGHHGGHAQHHHGHHTHHNKRYAEQHGHEHEQHGRSKHVRESGTLHETGLPHGSKEFGWFH